MSAILLVVFAFCTVFTVSDYCLGRALVRDPIRAIVSAVIALLFVIFVRSML